MSNGQAGSSKGRVLLVYADKGPVVMPQGVLHVAASLIHNGYEVRILDTRWEKPRPAHFEGLAAVGISSMTGSQIGESLKVCRMARSVSRETPLIWGGIHASLLPEQTLSHPLVDLVIREEGEETMPRVMDRLVRGATDFSDVDGVTFLGPDGKMISTPDRAPIDLDSVPHLPYDLLNLEKYPPTTAYFPYMSSRGCPFKCTFCYNRGVQSRWRRRSVEAVIDDLSWIHENFGLARGVHFVDDNLLTDPRHGRRLFEAKMSAGLKFEWNASTTIKGFLNYSDEDLKLLKESGLTYLRFGAESGSPKIIKQIRKNFTPPEAVEVVERCKRHEIVVVFNFMVGFPDETPEDREMSFDFIDDLRSRYERFIVKTIWRLIPFPGTEVFDQAVAEGYPVPQSLEGWAGYGYSNMPRLPWTDPDQFRQLEVINHITREDIFTKPRLGRRDIMKHPFGSLLKYSRWYRWKKRWFTFAPEWKIRSYLTQRKAGKGAI